ncbi:MAG TPA: wax ester/triacylglycerol synthase family O-acyltransferase [Acidimicrobiales bacterium]|nr:wax ester/triacylglycerol synthase family O-acyltransferase [Acidimicrobiales bacterium]
MERLSPLDAAFLEAEDADRHVSMAIASIAVFEGPAPTYEEFSAAIAARLPRVPRYRQRVRTVPLRLGPPVWVDDPDFDLGYHIRQVSLPAPGGDTELARMMAEVMAQRLDRDRPLWEDWLVTGLAGDHWAVISKVHHCMVDGVSGTDLYRVMFDQAPGTIEASAAAAPPSELAGGPSETGLLVRAALGTLLLPARATGALLHLVAHPGPAWQALRDTTRAARAASASLPPARTSSLSGPIGQQRRYAWATATLDDIRQVKRELGGTVNDVVLAAITAGFRALLLSRGEDTQPHMLPSLVPVSLRPPGGESVYDNEVSAMIVDLPVHVADPVEQLSAIRHQLGALKAANEAEAGDTLIRLAGFVPYNPWAALVRAGFRIPQREIVTVTTNVPGPRTTLYCLGRPMLQILPYVPLGSRVRIGVAIFSYRDAITFGITGDYDTTHDLEVLAYGIRDGLADLLKSAGDR